LLWICTTNPQQIHNKSTTNPQQIESCTAKTTTNLPSTTNPQHLDMSRCCGFIVDKVVQQKFLSCHGQPKEQFMVLLCNFQESQTSTSWEHCSRLQQSCCHAIIEDCMIPFALYTAAETRNAF